MFPKQMPLAPLASFCRRFGTGLRAGVSILRLLDSESRYGPPRQRLMMQQFAADLREGYPVDQAMQRRDGYFPRLVVALVSAGDSTGKLDETLLALADQLDERLRLRREFRQQISLPLLQLFIAVNVIGLLILLLGILRPPTGGEMFDPTGLGLRGSSGVVRYYSAVLLIGLAAAGGLLAIRHNFLGVHNLIPVLYRVPLIGPPLQTIVLSRFVWTLALTLESAIDPIRCLQLALDATDSDFYRSAHDQVADSVRRGRTIGETIQATGMFPEDLITAVEIAELSGTDAESLQHLSIEYGARASMALKSLASLASRTIAAVVTVTIVAMILQMLGKISGEMGRAMEPL